MKMFFCYNCNQNTTTLGQGTNIKCARCQSGAIQQVNQNNQNMEHQNYSSNQRNFSRTEQELQNFLEGRMRRNNARNNLFQMMNNIMRIPNRNQMRQQAFHQQMRDQIPISMSMLGFGRNSPFLSFQRQMLGQEDYPQRFLQQNNQTFNFIQGPTFVRYVVINGQSQQEQPERNPVSQHKFQELQKISEVKQCPVCQQNGGKGTKLPCKHQFHDQCIKPWFNEKNTCPCCRKEIQ